MRLKLKIVRKKTTFSQIDVAKLKNYDICQVVRGGLTDKLNPSKDQFTLLNIYCGTW